jgi:HPt (histidine-containing phosphotransfer) domain-containing protein
VTTLGKLCLGDFRECYEKYIDFALPKRCNPDLDVLVVDYVGLSKDDAIAIENRIRKRFDFEHIIFQKASSVMSLNCGMGAMGITYIIKGDTPYNLSQMLSTVEDPEGDEVVIDDSYKDLSAAKSAKTPSLDGASEEGTIAKEETREKQWFEEIPGIDPVKAIENSGSEESFKAVLRIFYESVEKNADEIQKFYENEDWTNYIIKVHALKSSSRLVGAMELGDAAYDLEMAGKDGKTDFIKEHTDELLVKYREYLDILAQYFEGVDAHEAVYSLDETMMTSFYDTIREAAETGEEHFIEKGLEEIAEYEIPSKDKDIIDRIRESYGKKDMASIIEIIDGREK